MAPTAGFEPATSKLTASCSTIELRRNTNNIITANINRGQAQFYEARNDSICRVRSAIASQLLPSVIITNTYVPLGL